MKFKLDEFEIADNLTQCQECNKLGIECSNCSEPISNLETSYCRKGKQHLCFDCMEDLRERE